MDADVRERFERIESNMLQFSEGMKEITASMKKLEEAQGRTNDVLHTLLDALFTQRGNGHSKQQLPE